MDSEEKAPETDRLTDALTRLVELQEAQPIKQVQTGKAIFKTPWNPTGKKNRAKLSRRTFLNDHMLREKLMTDEEITLVNQVKPGFYNGRKWSVLERDVDGAHSIHIYVPNKSQEQRIAMPRSFVELMQTILAEQKTSSKVA